jgi:hypothetical protein
MSNIDEWVLQDGSLYHADVPYVAWPSNKVHGIRLSGEFTLEQLKAIVQYVEERS